MTLTYQYKIFIDTTENIDFLKEKASKVSQITESIYVFTFDTFALEGELFQQLVDKVTELNSYACVIIGEDPGHIETYSRKHNLSISFSPNFNGVCIDEMLWSTDENDNKSNT